MIKIRNPESIDIHLSSKPRIRLFIISAWGGRGALCMIIQPLYTIRMALTIFGITTDII